jgi:hypothetical protein
MDTIECSSPLPYSSNVCSGNGYMCSRLDMEPYCICNIGWTSLGDLSFGTVGSECLIHYKAVRIMSYILIIIPSIYNILIIWHYLSLTKRKQSWYVITREYKTLFPLAWFIMGIALTGYCIIM